MNRKDYLKPTMKVVKLQHRCHILAGSGEPSNITSSRQGYGTASTADGTEDTWE